MNEVALELARLRASRSRPVARPSQAVDEAAAACGLRVVHLSGKGSSEIGLAWADGWAPARADEIVLPSLSKVGLAVVAIVLRQCWPDPNEPIFPGRSTRRSDVLEVMRRTRVDPRQGVGMLDVDLVELGIVRHEGDHITLGPSAGLWSSEEVAALRRLHRRFPAPVMS